MAICPDCENTLSIDLDDVEEEGYEDEDSSTFAAEEEE
jgi:hypothetical protein